MPEPGTLALLGVGLAVLGVAFRRLVADASHELGRPLAVIRAEAEIALTRQTRTESTAPGHAPTA